jgi:O-antigen/teichoic acid export membrane protein
MSFKKITLFTFSNYIGLLSALVQGLFTAKILSVTDMGSFSQVKIIVSYMLLLNPGVINGLIYKLPISKTEEGIDYASSAFFFSLFLFFSAFLVFLIIYFKTNHSEWFFAGLVLLFSSLKEVLAFSLRALQKFERLSLLTLFFSVSQAVLIIGFSIPWKLGGAMWALSLSSILSFVFGLFLLKDIIRFTFSIRRVYELFLGGWMIYLNGLYAMILSSFERISLSFAAEKKIFAVYSVGIFFVSIFDMLSSSVTQYLTPKMVKDGEGYSEEKLISSSQSILYIMTAFIFTSLLLMRFLVPVFLDKYTESVKIASILSVTSLFQVYYNMMFSKYLSLKKMHKYFPVQTIGAVMTVGGTLLYFVFGDRSNLVYFSIFILILRTLYFLISAVYFKITLNVRTITPFSIASITAGSAMFIAVSAADTAFFSVSVIIFILYMAFFYRSFILWKEHLR